MAKELKEIALQSNGCKVSYASCQHEGVASCENIIDGSRTTFWATTGLYPHYFTLSFPNLVRVSGIKIRSYFVKSMLIEKSSNEVPIEFDDIKSLDLELTDLHHQVTEIKLDDTSIRHLRFTVKDGYEEFCAVYKVEVLGNPSEGMSGPGPDQEDGEGEGVMIGAMVTAKPRPGESSVALGRSLLGRQMSATWQGGNRPMGSGRIRSMAPSVPNVFGAFETSSASGSVPHESQRDLTNNNDDEIP